MIAMCINMKERSFLNRFIEYLLSIIYSVTGWLKAAQGEKEDRLLQQHAHGKENQQC